MLANLSSDRTDQKEKKISIVLARKTVAGDAGTYGRHYSDYNNFVAYSYSQETISLLSGIKINEDGKAVHGGYNSAVELKKEILEKYFAKGNPCGITGIQGVFDASTIPIIQLNASVPIYVFDRDVNYSKAATEAKLVNAAGVTTMDGSENELSDDIIDI